MTTPIVVLLLSLLVIVIVQTINRLAGAILLFAWCAAAIVYGLDAFDTGVELKMFGIEARRWNFVAFMSVMLLYNAAVIFRVFKKRRRSDDTPDDVVDAVLEEERERTR